MNFLIVLLRIIFGLILLLAINIAYIIAITILFIAIIQLCLLLISISIILYDIYFSLFMIMILGIYDYKFN